jgi:integrase
MLVKHIENNGGQVNYYRRAYPPHLRKHLGKTQHRVSLGKPDAPDFLSRYAKAAAQWAADVARAERLHSGEFDKLDAPRLAFLGKLFEVQWLQAEDASRKAGVEGWAEKVGNGWEWHLVDFQRWYAEADGDAAEEHWGRTARNLAEAQGLLLDPDDDQFRQLCMELNEAALRVSEVSLARLKGKAVPSPELPEPPSSTTKPKRSKVPLLDTFDLYTVSKGISKASYVQEWRRYLGTLTSFVGHDDLSRLTRDDVAGWRDHLLATPSASGKPRGHSTVKNNYLSPLKSTLSYAVQEKKLATNVAADVRVSVPKRVTTRQSSFYLSEAQAILSASLKPVTSNLSAPYVRARRWVPWLCAYSGARVNEIGQLRKEDIKNIDGFWVMNITPEAGTVKSREARLVPLHPHILDQGFLEMVEKQPDGPLFYDPVQKLEGSKSTRHRKKVGERLRDWVREEVGIIDPAIQPNHAWRHLFKTLCMDAEIDGRISDSITGHALDTEGQKYGHASLKAKSAALEKFPRFEIGVSD